jgi:hypothetical protein
MQFRSFVALAVILLAVSACVMEPSRGGRGQYNGAYNGAPYNTGSNYGHSSNSGYGPQGHGRPGWQD